MRHDSKRNVCFVTGTRAEFGLMQSVLREIRKNRKLPLQIIATGMHLDPAHGLGAEAMKRSGWTPDLVVSWPAYSGRDCVTNAQNTGNAIAGLADAFGQLKTDIVLSVGDRVEAFAAATAAHIGGIAVAHIHGGDRAAGQVDDSLRHAITKLAHVHFPATRESAKRIYALGEERWRIIRAGSPGLDGIVSAAASKKQIDAAVGRITPMKFALLLLHPTDPDPKLEFKRATMVFGAAAAIPFERIVIVYPNNDPGAAGIIRCWESLKHNQRLSIHRDLSRPVFLGLLRDAAVLLGNSSSGIIEAASFGTPVIDIGDRQKGRERGINVRNVPFSRSGIERELRRVWNNGQSRRFTPDNIYGGTGAGRIIARTLASIPLNSQLLRKLIRY